MADSYKKDVRRILCFAVAVYSVLGLAGRICAEDEEMIKLPRPKKEGFFRGEPRMHIGAFEMHPFVFVKQTFDSNVFLEPHGDEDKDFITQVTTGIGVQMPLIPERGDDFMIKASYRADIIKFWREHQVDRVDHEVTAKIDFAFANDFMLTVEEFFEKTADPPNNERTSLDRRYRNIINTTLGYTKEAIAFETSYQITRDEYESFNNIDRTDHMLTGTCYYQILPKTAVLAEYNFGIVKYDNHDTNSDSRYHQVRVGATGALWPKLTGTVKTGCRFVRYRGGGRDDFTGVAVYGSLKYDMTERTVVNFYAERTPVESSYATNSHYEANKAGLTFVHLLLERLWFNGSGFFQYNRYPETSTEGGTTTKRRDVLWGLGGGFKYEVTEWLLAYVDYEFKQRGSKFSIFSYNDHMISTRLALKF